MDKTKTRHKDMSDKIIGPFDTLYETSRKIPFEQSWKPIPAGH